MAPELIERLLLSLLGPVIGSCVGLLSLRLPAGAPVAIARSACGHCGRKLGPLDLVPLLSWLVLRGRCRTCGGAIPWRYPAIEIGCALIGLWSALAFDGPLAWATAGLGWGLLLIAMIDAEHYWLPARLTAPLLVGGLAVAVLLHRPALLDSLIGAALGWGFLALLAVVYRRLRGRDGLGGGDPLMLGAIGAWVGWEGLPSVTLIAAAAGLGVAVLLKRTKGDSRLPFGSLMAVGAWIVWLSGPIGR